MHNIPSSIYDPLSSMHIGIDDRPPPVAPGRRNHININNIKLHYNIVNARLCIIPTRPP